MLLVPRYCKVKKSTVAKVLITSTIIHQINRGRYFSNTSLLNNNNNNNNRKMSFIPPQAPPSWNHTPEQILKETEEYITQGRKLRDDIVKLDNPNIENAFKPYAFFENESYGKIDQLTFYQHVSADKSLRDASTQAEEKIKDFAIEQGSREDVFKIFNKLYNEFNDKNELNDQTKKYLKEIVSDFKRNGLALPLEERAKITKIQKRLAILSTEYNKNLGEQKEFLLFTKNELDGVPKDVVDGFEKIKDNNDVEKFKMTFKYPDLFPVLKYAKNPETRKKAFINDQNKVPQNEALLKEAVKLRAELAKLLGYDSFAEYILEKKMAKNSEIVLKFLNDLKEKLTPVAKIELKKLLNLKNKDLESKGLNKSNDYYIWENRYYDTMLLEQEYKVDQQKIAEYFPMTSTINKMLQIFEKLMNLKFIEIIDPNEKSVWHQDVKQFSVWNLDDFKNPKFIGWLYFDLHPRDGKYGHAANFGISPSFIKKNGLKSYPVTALVCNFSKPTNGKPSLLKHDEVTTFFHELGHGIHDLVGDVEYATFHGPSGCSWDFVECPSQMLEYWTWNKDELKFLSSHYKTGESIDDSLIDSLIRSKHVNGGLFNLRQLHFGLFDMTLHSINPNVDLTKFWNESREKIALISSGGIETKGFNSFGHIMGGYQAGYYGYLWSQVFAADIYYTKFKSNPLDSKIGKEYRDIILARGGSRPELDNLKELLGREPNSDAFSKELGL